MSETVADVMWAMLAQAGVQRCYGIVGDALNPVIDGLRRHSPAVLQQRPIVNLLHSPRLAADKQDKPAVHELVENVPHDIKVEQAWIGDGILTLLVVDGEEVSDLAPVRCGRGI